MKNLDIPCGGKYCKPVILPGRKITGGTVSRDYTRDNTVGVCVYDQAKNESDEVVELLRPGLSDKPCDTDNCPLVLDAEEEIDSDR